MENLTLTWKVDENIHQHVDIKERDKPNEFSLGKSLLIGQEVCAHFVYLFVVWRVVEWWLSTVVIYCVHTGDSWFIPMLGTR